MEQVRKEQLYQIFKEASQEKVHVEDWPFLEGFNTILYKDNEEWMKFEGQDVPVTLEIRDVSKFEEAMDNYVNQMLQFLKEHPLFYTYDNVYFDGNKEAQEKYIMTTLWSNATISDFQNPLDYLEKRIQFLKDTTFKEENFEVDVSDCFPLENAKLVYGVEAQHPNMETPFVFKAKIIQQEESYALPSISYGIKEGKCFIYAIQDPENHGRQDSFYKKVKRALYRANKGVEDDYFAERITDVSPAQVCSVSLFLGAMNQREIKNFEAVSYLPMRYQAKELLLLEKQKKMEKLLSSLEEPVKAQLLAEMEETFSHASQLQENITNKFLRNFMRIKEQLDGLTVTSYPGELDFSLHFKTEKELTSSTPSFILDLYQKTYQNPSSSKSK